MSSPPEKKLEIVAHRGFSALAPENTLAAFAAAIKWGADSLEFDIQLSSDGVPIVIHDVTLDRICGTPGLVKEKTLKELKTLDVGSWFDMQFSGERIPTLEEALAAAKTIKKYIYFDVKPHCDWNDAVVDLFVNILRNGKWENRCVISSFNEEFVERVRRIAPEFTFGYIVASAEAYQSQLEKASATGNSVMISLYKLLLENPSFIEISKSQGVDIVAWTVDNLEEARQLASMGVWRIITNSLIGI
ncbi:MAG: glycerophosphodiester phosphodiesterase family protein [Oscillatoriaceae bacterium SKW80]|nr:glycerophosphodiester phosphodiesterase [Oscillatoriaceae bacterium SKYG93]MCX8121334.1 glycerophosphodiester phosphodiesterase family protein [Oscillatoriaceae bacterium SKW80]MDW8453332.1 glycerophosphodiester phosphodiesterase family protein [Oscillatoriaceae cyanobacterium SKYGB_i_bin93]HIK26686.1 glycerophosphodiester phosphodiesterase [Oscillatoriaceae cyanobacterium M7585_C2015_266]